MALNKNLANVTAYVLFIQALHNGGTVQELLEETGLSTTTIKKFIAVAHRRGLVYVKSWDKDRFGRHIRVVWAWGSKPDAAKPPAMTPTERSRLARARNQARTMQFLKERKHGKHKKASQRPAPVQGQATQ